MHGIIQLISYMDRGAGYKDSSQVGRHLSDDEGVPAESRDEASARDGTSDNIRRTVCTVCGRAISQSVFQSNRRAFSVQPV